MKKKLFLAMILVVALVCLFTVVVSAETAYINSKGEQIAEGSEDIAYELYFEGVTGNARLKEIYLHDTAVTKIIVPAVKFTINSKEYDLSTYSYVRLAAGWNVTLPVYPIAEKGAETKTSVHTQIKEIEFHIPVLADGSSQVGNLAGYTSLEKISYFARAYESQGKGGFVANCPNLKEVHFYGQDNRITGNFFCAPSIEKIVFHKGSTSTLHGQVFQNINSASSGNPCTVYLNENVLPGNTEDPRLTWNKTARSLNLVILVDETSGYTAEEIASHDTIWQAGNNKNANNYKYKASVMTYCDFYDGHISEEPINDCVCYCETCKNYGTLANPAHVLDFTMEYANGYNAKGVKTIACTNEGCAHIEKTEELVELFGTRGYSRDEDSSAIVLDFTANVAAINVYEEYLKKTSPEASINYGVVVALGDNDDDITNDVLFNGDGTAKDNVIIVKFPEKNYTNIQTKVMGINNIETELHLSGYVNVSGVIKYINGENVGDYSAKVTYGMFQE